MDAGSVIEAIAERVRAVENIARVTTSRRKRELGSGRFTAGVFYAGEEIAARSTGGTAQRFTHRVPIIVELQSTADDPDVVNMIYAILDSLTDPENTPTGVSMVTPERVEPPPDEMPDLFAAQIHLLATFQRARGG